MTDTSLIGRAVAEVVKQNEWTPIDLTRLLLGLCETKTQAHSLNNELQKLGYVERRIAVTDRARKRAMK